MAVGGFWGRTLVAVLIALAALVAESPDASALSQFATAHGQKYGLVESECSFCHNNGNQARTNLNSYGQALQGFGLSAADANNPQKILDALEAVEGNFSPIISGSTNITVPAQAAQVTVDFTAGGDRGNATGDPIVAGAPRVETPASGGGFNFSANGGSSVTINFSLSDTDRGNLRRAAGAGQPHKSFQFRPQNVDGFRPTIASTLADNRANLFFANMPPEATADNFTMQGDAANLAGNVFTQGVDRDPDGDAFRAVLVSNVTLGTLVLQEDGSFEYTPPPPDAADQTAAFTYKLTETGDASIESSTVTVSILIKAVAAANNPPVASDDAYTTNEDNVLEGNVITDGPVPDTDPDAADIATLEARLVSAPKFGTAVFLNSTGAFRYTPNANATGDASNRDAFKYQLLDRNGGLDEALVTITLVPENDAPTVTPGSLPTVNERQGVQTVDLLSTSLVSDVDTPRASLIVSAVSFALSDETVVRRADVNPTANGATVTYDPAEFALLDSGQTTSIIVSYSVSDGSSPAVANTVTLPIVGVDNGLGRVAGQYADTLRGRYNGHFLPASVQNDACHSCHNVGQVNVQVRTRDQCTATVFNPYGLQICLNRRPNDPPLVDLVRRLAEAETEFAPQLDETAPIEIEETLPAGSPVGPPLTAMQSPGKTFKGATASIHGFAFVSGGTLSEQDSTGQFRIADSGQITTEGELRPGVYTLDVRPINDVGQMDGAGNVRSGIPGLYPIIESRLRFVTVTVRGVIRQPVSDAVNTSEGVATSIDVTANDTPGSATGIVVKNAPTNGTAGVEGLTVTYTPASGFVGQDTFTYATVNGTTESATTATVTITVVAAGGAVAINDTATVVAGEDILVDVAANDAGRRPLTITIETPPDEGVATVEAGGIRYTPPPGFVGEVGLVYRASNSLGFSTAQLIIDVVNVNGDVLESGTKDPELKKVARAMGDTCAALSSSSGSLNADQQDLVKACSDLAADIGGGNDVSTALSAIRNEEMFAAGEAMMIAGRLTGRSIIDRLDDVVNGRRPVDVSGVSLAFGEQTFSGQGANEAIARAFGLDGANGEEYSPWGAFLSGDIVFADQDSVGSDPGFDLVSASLTAGVDYRIGQHKTLGGLAL